MQRALKIDPNLAFAHFALGMLHRDYDWDWVGAKAEFERALELDPHDANARMQLSYLEGNMQGRYDEVIGSLRDALLLNPVDTFYLARLGTELFEAGHMEESASVTRKALRLNPTSAGAYAELALALLFMGQHSEALSAVESESDELERLTTLPIVYWKLDRRADSEAALAQLKEKYAAVAATNIAEVHAYRGEFDSAFDWLHRAYRQRDAGMQWLKTDRLLLNLHDDPRYSPLLAKMNLAN